MDVNDIRNAIIRTKKLQYFDRSDEGDRLITDVGNVFVREVHDSEPIGEGGYDGAHEQGYVGVAWIIFFVEEENEHYKQFGTLDSYNGVSWDGEFRAVRAVKKEVTVYE